MLTSIDLEYLILYLFYRKIIIMPCNKKTPCNKDKKSCADKKVSKKSSKKVCDNNKSPINFFTRVKNWILGINKP